MTKYLSTNNKVDASIITSDLQITVKNKQQLMPFVAYLMMHEYDYQFEWTYEGNTPSASSYTLTIFNITWANNLVDIVTELAKYDYSFNDEIPEKESHDHS